MKQISKNLLALLFLTCAAFACAPTTPAVTDTTTLVSGSKTLALTKSDSVMFTGVSLTCGCRFPVYTESRGGDTTVILLSLLDLPTDTTSAHQLQASYTPSTSAPGSYSSWIALRAIHIEPGTRVTLRDTVFATATVQ